MMRFAIPDAIFRNSFSENDIPNWMYGCITVRGKPNTMLSSCS